MKKELDKMRKAHGNTKAPYSKMIRNLIVN